MSWTDFFDALARLEPDDEFVSGRPGGLSDEMAERMADDIARKLGLEASDRLLDYGAGNGAITRQLACRVSATTAAEASEAARERGRAAGGINISWVGISAACPQPAGTFTKVLSYYNARAIQRHGELRRHIETLCAVVAPGGVVLFGDVPDRERTVQWESGERGREENRTVWIGRLERRALDMQRHERELQAFLRRLAKLGIEPPVEYGGPHRGFVREVVLRMFRELGGAAAVMSQPLDFPNAHTCVDYVVTFPD